MFVCYIRLTSWCILIHIYICIYVYVLTPVCHSIPQIFPIFTGGLQRA
jgi:hypothetical protein